ncbi:hypothetical protein N9W41_00980 [bacterium]|nr:hypothetical protein [bacterium]
MTSDTCDVCLTNKTILTCGLCNCHSCKTCSEIVAEETFEFLSKIPEKLSHDVYCPNCYDEVVAPELDSYNGIMKRAEAVDVFDKKQGKESRKYHRKEDPIKVTNCFDREETLMRLAFFAAEKDFDIIVDVDLVSRKVTTAGKHKRLIWEGTAVPVAPSIRRIDKNCPT